MEEREKNVIIKKKIFKNNLSELYFEKERKMERTIEEERKRIQFANCYVANSDNSFANYVLHIC